MLDAILNLAREILFFAGYVSGGNSFPPQLSPEEEKAYIVRLSEGDQEAAASSLSTIYGWWRISPRSTAPQGGTPDDLISIGTVGLIKAVSTFKPDKGNTLATYAARCIENPTLTCCLHRLKLITPSPRIPAAMMNA